MVNQEMQKGQAKPSLQIAIYCIAAMIYLGIWLLMSSNENAYLQLDSYDYLLLGQAIFNDFNFPSSFRTPLFPLFVGFWEALLGLKIQYYILIQILLALVNIYLLGRLVSYFLSAKMQLLVMLVFAVELVTAQVANYVLAETLFSFLLLLALNFLVLAQRKQKYAIKYAVICGVVLGLYALCRPVGQFIPFVLVVWYFLYKRSDVNIRTQVLAVCLVIFGTLLSVHAWKFHNYVTKEQYFTSVTMSYNIYNYRAAWNVAYRDGRSFEDVKDEFHAVRKEFKLNNLQATEYDIGQHFFKEGLNIIIDTPKETFFQAVRGLVFLYGGIYNGSLDRIFKNQLAKKIAQIYTFLYNCILYAGILLSVLFIRRLEQQERSLLIMSGFIVAYYNFFSIGVESYARLRAPFIPYLVIIAVVGWMKLWQFKTRSS